MRVVFPVVVLGLLVSAPLGNQHSRMPGAPTGAAAPHFSLDDLDRRPVQLATVMAGARSVVLHFWNDS
jgi:hypothetical protein